MQKCANRRGIEGKEDQINFKAPICVTSGQKTLPIFCRFRDCNGDSQSAKIMGRMKSCEYYKPEPDTNPSA